MKKKIKLLLILPVLLTMLPNRTRAQSGDDSKAKFFIEGAKTIKKIIEYAAGIWPHKWSVIKYADGYCIFNRFRAKRTMQDVVDHSMGKGDCDWWPWPEGSRHVCLDSEAHAYALVKKHGKIVDIRWIDHPTADCGH